MARRALGCAFAILGLLGTAQAQTVGRDGYRTGVPPVLSPPAPPAPPPETLFQAGYRRAGFPRMVLFFNRDISDVAASNPVVQRREGVSITDNERLQGQVPAPAAATPATSTPDTGAPATGSTPAAGGSTADAGNAARSVDLQSQRGVQVDHTTRVSIERQPAGARTALVSEAQQWLFEAGFNRSLAAQGTRLVDRAVAMRLAASLRLDDPQRLETEAIQGLADIAIVVRFAALDREARTADLQGVVMRITAISTRNGQILTDDTLVPPRSSGDPADAASQAGGVAAAQLMSRLAIRWMP